MAERLDCRIGQMESHHLETMCQWFEAEGWSAGRDYFSMLFKLQPQGFFSATTEKGTLLSVCVAWILDENYARIARLLTAPDYRGKGIGKSVLNSVFKYFGNRNIGLSGAKYTEPFYNKLGFVETEYKINLIRGKVRKFQSQDIGLPCGVTVLPIQKISFADLFCYDTSIHGIQREELLKAWVDPNRSKTFVAVNDKGTVIGYGSQWKTDIATRIMPLYADDVAVARMLLNSLIGSNEEIQIGIYCNNLKNNELWKDWLDIDDEQIQNYFAVQMFTKTPVKPDIARTYCLMDFDCSFA